MSYGIHSDEVAEDYRKALEDLTMNSRYEISNLTVIARENTEHALAISEALKNHIKTTAPVKKLPAFYVLDSVVKNVGTPYTLFFGRNLYSTFMEAYVLVDNNVRRKMDEMLKTWKEPVPGSIDTRPVFPVDITRPIENALIKARTATLQAHQQEYARSQQQSMFRGRQGATTVPFRETPTPPNAMRPTSYAPPVPTSTFGDNYLVSSATPNLVGQPLVGQPYIQRQFPTPPPQHNHQYAPPQSSTPTWQQPQPPQGYGAPDASIDTLNRDIEELITSSKAEFALNPYDGGSQTRLKALLDLQIILQSQKLPTDQIALIRDQVAQLSLSAKPRPSIPVLPPKPVAVSQPPPQQPSLSSLLGGPDALAALLARSSAKPKISTPPTQYVQRVGTPSTQPVQPQYPPVPPKVPSMSAVTDASSLLERLRAAGMIPAPTSTPPISHSPLPGGLPIGIPNQLPYLNNPTSFSKSRPALAEIPNDVQLKPAALKIPRPHLISMLYEKLGQPCSQCGRRFQGDEEGKKKKTAHMDWHFRIHQRMTEAEKRGQHRSWYVDELDWIKSRESEDEALVGSANGAIASDGNDASPKAKMPKLQYVAVPDDPALANSVCPICQEKFEMKWLDEAQEFVWMDAVKIGDRIYHASCHAEAKKDGGSTPLYQRGTPEPVLGKRKHEEDHMAMRVKFKNEPLV